MSEQTARHKTSRRCELGKGKAVFSVKLKMRNAAPVNYRLVINILKKA
ncbi:hypothetical protein J4731_16680 [Providencia rettgeri]|nr:hypothetical protein [Providencia rettgeri]